MEPVIGGVFEAFAEGARSPRSAVPAHPLCGHARMAATSRTCATRCSLPTFRALHPSGFGLFEKIVGTGGVVRAIPAPAHGGQEPQVLRRHERLGAGRRLCGLGYVTRKGGEFGGPIAKNHGTEGMEKLYAELGLGRTTACSSRGKEDQAPSWRVARTAWASSSA
jgi:aspartyl-tRNA synthetase